MQPPTPTDATLLADAALTAIGTLTVATFVMVWKLRDAVRDLTAVVSDPRTGLTVTIDRVATTVDGIDRRVQKLEIWREAQDEGFAD